MSQKETCVSLEEAAGEVGVAMTRLALLHLAFSETLVRELGEERAKQLIVKSIMQYGKRVGERIRRGLPDLPKYGVYGKFADGRVYDCVLARIFREYGEEDLGCLYCYVDAAKTMAVDASRKLIHKDCATCGDDYYTFEEAPTTAKERADFEDLATEWKKIDRRIEESRQTEGKKEDMTSKIDGYSIEELTKMDPPVLRAILHERTHHTIEVMIYAILNGKLKKPKDFGNQARRVLDVWRKRGLPIDAPDLRWCIDYVRLADKLNKGESVALDIKLPEPFSTEEMRIVKRLLYDRRSIRQFKNKRVPETIVRKILFAGLMAPQGCNICSTRFIILRKPEEWKLVRSDIPIRNGVMIVVCQDMRLYRALKFDEYVPHNVYYDAAAAADHMCLMAHALGLGACWLTHGEETQKALRKHFRLPEHIVSRCHIIVGWPHEAPIKSKRISLDEAIIGKSNRPARSMFTSAKFARLEI